MTVQELKEYMTGVKPFNYFQVYDRTTLSHTIRTKLTTVRLKEIEEEIEEEVELEWGKMIEEGKMAYKWTLIDKFKDKVYEEDPDAEEVPTRVDVYYVGEQDG